ncbi:MAG: flagellar export protein FliJ [Pseudomonadales bacterium]|nr:flagellar export protein FliJ [Pseudomonadales bacterium]MCP5319236.1 flagellar export protein FliJ [Pseudomonadales bacterium]MCP5338043.1 flagellar export protein FliJ [Pseudomonadales bacterium]
MKPRSARLQTLAQLAALAERDARLRLGRANAELHRREAQQSQLESWAQEYATQWLQAGQSGIPGHALTRLAAFCASLDGTLETQRQAVLQARDASAQAVTRWHGVRNRQRAFDELAARLRRDEQQAAARQEQLRLDELAGIASRAGLSEGG